MSEHNRDQDYVPAVDGPTEDVLNEELEPLGTQIGTGKTITADDRLERPLALHGAVLEQLNRVLEFKKHAFHNKALQGPEYHPTTGNQEKLQEIKAKLHKGWRCWARDNDGKPTDILRPEWRMEWIKNEIKNSAGVLENARTAFNYDMEKQGKWQVNGEEVKTTAALECENVPKNVAKDKKQKMTYWGPIHAAKSVRTSIDAARRVYQKAYLDVVNKERNNKGQTGAQGDGTPAVNNDTSLLEQAMKDYEECGDIITHFHKYLSLTARKGKEIGAPKPGNGKRQQDSSNGDAVFPDVENVVSISPVTVQDHEENENGEDLEKENLVQPRKRNKTQKHVERAAEVLQQLTGTAAGHKNILTEAFENTSAETAKAVLDSTSILTTGLRDIMAKNSDNRAMIEARKEAREMMESEVKRADQELYEELGFLSSLTAQMPVKDILLEREKAKQKHAKRVEEIKVQWASSQPVSVCAPSIMPVSAPGIMPVSPGMLTGTHAPAPTGLHIPPTMPPSLLPADSPAVWLWFHHVEVRKYLT